MGIVLLFWVSLGWSFIESLKAPEQLQLRHANFERTINSMVPLDFCSGTYVSNQGHILTALHCFEGGYPKEMQSAPLQEVSGRWEHAFFTKTVFGPGRKHKPGTLKDLFINGKSVANVEIVFSGSRLGVNYLDTAAEDFIILKVPTHTKTTCSPVFTRRPKAGEVLWSYGYPSAFVVRDGVEMGDSMTLKISNGKVSPTVAQSIGKTVDVLNLNQSDISMQEFLSDTMEYRKNTYLISTDVDEGMSGGPVVDKNGYVVGVIAQAVPTLFKSERRRLNMQSISGLVQAMQSMMSDEEIHEVFDCESN